DTNLTSWITSLARQPAFYQAVTDGKGDEITRRIVKRWFAHPSAEKNVHMAQSNLDLALNLKLPESLIPAQQVLAAESAQPLFKQLAILVIGQYGNKEHLAKVEPYLQDTTKCINFGLVKALQANPVEIQTRDLALAVMIHLSGQDPKDYGYEFL